ncbi:hypothetical protein MNEG_5440 [Monoraphidium neglectum]|uniref:Uncharacterized protein n=1 Tax=Monoraphidium neglectum TaxID=145388 RepID=A0A0D2NAC2_9CHLO|nr:hypothetical protein MNEG_5440 [Monoraphidium neglectum]KIZ02521.1 hypothetical protein MNEG_5440 [Monoraphidium neglectum]|eukprot:XP_013901540.1 hypothetical protein MNEG_5440 [Monoraphidium neglectum]
MDTTLAIEDFTQCLDPSEDASQGQQAGSLVLVAEGGEQRRFPLFSGANIVGRAPPALVSEAQREEEWAAACNLPGGAHGVFIPDPTLSSPHALVAVEGAFCRVKDLGSRNKARANRSSK